MTINFPRFPSPVLGFNEQWGEGLVRSLDQATRLINAALPTTDTTFYEDLVPYDGVTDASDAINALLAEGRVISLRDEARGSYLIKKPILITVANSGLICLTGRAKIVMSTAAGCFDNNVYADRYSVTTAGGKKYAVGIDCQSASGVLLSSLYITTSAWVDCRYLKAINLDTCPDAIVYNNKISSFSRTQGAITVNDCNRIRIVGNYITDLYTRTVYESDGVTLSSSSAVQLTGIEVDGDCTVGSDKPEILGNRIHNLTPSATVITQFGNQSDAINLQGTGSKPTKFARVEANDIYNVGEGIDCFGTDAVINGNTFERCYNSAVKLIHGASRCIVSSNSMREIGLYAIILGASNSAGAADIDGNLIAGNRITNVNRAIDWYEYDGSTKMFTTSAGSAPGDAATTAGIRINVIAGALWQVKNTVIRDNVISPGTNADYGIFMEANADGQPQYLRSNRITEWKTREYRDDSAYFRWEETQRHVIESQASYTLTNNTSAQNIFNSAVYSKFNIYIGRRYRLRVRVTVTGLSASANSLSFGLSLTTATISRVLGTGTGHKGSGAASSVVHTNLTSATAQQITPSDTQTTATFEAEVTFTCTASGTVAPQLTMNTNSAAASVSSGAIAELTEDRNTATGYGDVA